jgi:pSer/pThr/pTyr-binding forkhead associated (FHA) protein
MARLTMLRGPTVGAVYELTADVVTLGRGSKNEIVIQDNEVSREHLRLVRVAEGYEVRDLGSSNGTFINGQRVVGNWQLHTGFVLELGDSITLEYESGATATARTAGLATPDTGAVAVAPPKKNYALLMTVGPDAGRMFPLEEDVIKIGRDLSNDLVVQDPEVSRVHLRFRRLPETYEVEDMESTNGTTVNGEKLTGLILLKQADVLKLGSGVQFQFVMASPDPALLGGREGSSTPFELSNFTRETSTSLHKPNNKRKTTHLGSGLTPGALKDHIYLAYAREDWEPLIAHMTVSLQDAGIPVWVDQYLKPGGDDWLEAIEQALFECWMMIVVVTEESVSQPNVKMQYRYFMNHEKPLLPLLMDAGISLPVELAKKRAIVHEGGEDQWATFHRLINAIKELRKPPEE